MENSTNQQQTRVQRMRAMTEEDIKRMNDEFNSLEPRQQRLEIAREVLSMLTAKEFVASGGYASVMSQGEQLVPLPKGNLQINIVNGLVCEGCARGAVFVARAVLGNDVHVGDPSLRFDDALVRKVSADSMGQNFGPLIETLYEDEEDFPLSDILEPWSNSEKQAHADFMEFKESLPDRQDNPEGRMRAIFENIVANGGNLRAGKTEHDGTIIYHEADGVQPSEQQ